MTTSTPDYLPRRPERAPERVQQRAFAQPRVDVFENKDELLLVVDLSGAAKDTVNVNVDKGQLTIEARRAAAERTGTLLAREFVRRDYQRTFTLPQGIDGSKIEAQLTNGVLRLRLPKSDALKPRRIDVKGS